MTFIDTGIMVGAVLEKHPEHQQCVTALETYTDCVTDAHALAETFATLTGFYKVPVDAAAELTLGLSGSLRIEPLPLAIYETAIREARSRGVMGGAFTMHCIPRSHAANVRHASLHAILLTSSTPLRNWRFSRLSRLRR
jgi:hypothetical protein